jgi:hypothetical protein
VKPGSTAHYVRYKNKFVRKTEINHILKTASTAQKGGYYPTEKRYVFVSDLEGRIPLNLVKDVICKYDALSEHDKFDALLLCPEDTVLVFTGDLIDRGNEQLRLLQTFELLANSGRAVLVVGNRDVNKMRLKHELYSETLANIIRNVISNRQNNSQINLEEIISELVPEKITEPKWSYGWEYLKDVIIDIPGIYSGMTSREVMPDKYDGWERVTWTYANTMGAQLALPFFREELNDIAGIQQISDDVLGALLAMIMSNDWGVGIYVYTSLSVSINLNNLYYRYLVNTMLFFEKQIGANYVFATHSGLPKCDDPGLKQFCKNKILLRTKYDYEKLANLLPRPNNTNTNVDTNYNDIIQAFYADQMLQPDKIPESHVRSGQFKLLMSMAAACGGDIQRGSPIVGYTNNDKDGPCQWGYEGYTIKLPTSRDQTNSIDGIFNICGHQPVGLVPEVGKVVDSENKSHYHVRLDVSKAEDLQNTNSKVYCALIFDQQGNVMIKCAGTVPSKRKRSTTDERVDSKSIEIEIAKNIDDYIDESQSVMIDGKHRRYFPINQDSQSMQSGYDIYVKYRQQQSRTGV